jgi:hypothetical protein
MLRGYRSLGFAALAALVFVSFGLGVFTISLGYPEQQERYQPYQSGNENKIGSLATVPDLASSGMKNTPCKKPQSDAERDLCEQWRAANAAEKSAQWTVFGVIASIIGISLLLWQIMLTREAVQDTGDATKAMREANEMARDANRAWVTIEIEPTLVSISGKKCYVGCNLKFTNMGNGVAVKFSCTATLKAKSGDEGDFVPDEFIDIHVKNEMPEVPNSKVVIVPGDFYEMNTVSTDIFDGEKIGGLKFLLTVSAFYRIAESDSVWRKSVRAFQITRKMRPDPRLKVTGLLPFKENEMLRTESLTFEVITGLLAT